MNPKKIEYCNNIGLEILNYWPNKHLWERNFDGSTSYKLVEVNWQTAEYRQIKSLFESTSYNIFGRSCGIQMLKLYRIENPFLLGQYLLKKEMMGYPSEKRLFHATSADCSSICMNNFNWRFAGRSRGTLYGRGVSFSPKSVYARIFGKKMFVVKVLVGEAAYGHSLTLIPPAPYDTTKSPCGMVYVKYEDNDFYPEYLIEYV